MRLTGLFIALFSFCSLATVFAYDVPNAPTGYVNDYASILSGETKSMLESELRLFTASTSNEVTVVIVPDLGGDTIEHYATKLFEAWKIGNAKKDNGVLFLISYGDHKARIEVGYGLEGALPDITVSTILQNDVLPEFKKNQYDKGVIQGVRSIEQATKGEYVAGSKSKASNGAFSFDTLFIFIIIGIQVLVFLSSILARSKSWWLGGIVGGVIGGALTVFGVFGLALLSGGVITVVFVILGLLFDYFISKTYKGAVATGTSIPWWAGGGHGGGFGGSRSSSSSFGGFSGGSSGGGGSSGSW